MEAQSPLFEQLLIFAVKLYEQRKRDDSCEGFDELVSAAWQLCDTIEKMKQEDLAFSEGGSES